MEFSPSPLTNLKRLEAQVNAILRSTDINKLSRKYREAVSKLRQALTDARIYINAYELSETRDEQLEASKMAQKWVEEVIKYILMLSEADIFGAIDVAELSARAGHIIGNLK